jgi:hypothetical protein
MRADASGVGEIDCQREHAKSWKTSKGLNEHVARKGELY